ncbi:MAG: putative zinc metalloprotease Rip3 [Chlamydiae bacterium]|nr:putative zinc metalloprotease Rip3 [Chlamydiota bacterium]
MIRIPTPIPIQIHPLFWLVCLLIGFLYSGMNLALMFLWVVVIFVSVLFHELGHALCARAFGQQSVITLMAFGGVTQHTGKDLSASKQFLITLMGPLFGFILFAIFYSLAPFVPETSEYLSYFVRVMVIINLLWSVINLFPILPMDGGQLVRIVLEKFFQIKGLKAAVIISIVFSVVIGGLSLVFGQWILAMLFFFFAFQSFALYSQVRPLRQQDTNVDIVDKFQEAQKKLIAKDQQGAKKDLEEIRQNAKEGVLYLQSTEMLVSILKNEGDYKQAYELLQSIKDTLSFEGKILLQELAYHEKNYQEALKAGRESFEEFPNAEVAFKNSACCAYLNKASDAIGWFESAIEYGLKEPLKAVERSEFDSIRDTKEFQAFVATLQK